MFYPSGPEKKISLDVKNFGEIFTENELKKTSLKSYIEEKGLSIKEINEFANNIDNLIRIDDSALAKKLKNDDQARKKFIISLMTNDYLNIYCQDKLHSINSVNSHSINADKGNFKKLIKSAYFFLSCITVDSDNITDIVNRLGKNVDNLVYFAMSFDFGEKEKTALRKIGQCPLNYGDRIKLSKAMVLADLLDNISGIETLNKEQINFLIKHANDIFYTNLDIQSDTYSKLDLPTKIDLLRYSFGKLPSEEIENLKTKLESKNVDIDMILSISLDLLSTEQTVYENTEQFLKSINKYNIPTMQLLFNISSSKEKKIAVNQFLSQLPVNKVDDAIKFLIDNKFIEPEDFSRKQLTVETVKDELKKEKQKFFKILLGFKEIDKDFITKTFENKQDKGGLKLNKKQKEYYVSFLKENLEKIKEGLISTDDAPFDFLLHFFREEGLFDKLSIKKTKGQQKFVFNFMKNILNQDIKNVEVKTFLKNDDLIDDIYKAATKTYPNKSVQNLEKITITLSYAIYKVAEEKGVKKVDNKFIQENLKNIGDEFKNMFNIFYGLNKKTGEKSFQKTENMLAKTISHMENVLSTLSNMPSFEVSLETLDKNTSKLEQKISKYTKYKSYEEFLQNVEQERQELKISKVITKEITEEQAYLIKETNQDVAFQEIEGVYVVQAKVDTKGGASKIIEIKSLDIENANFELAKIMIQNRLNFPIDFSNWSGDDFNKLVNIDFSKNVLKQEDFDKIQKFLQVYLVDLYKLNPDIKKFFEQKDIKLIDIVNKPKMAFSNFYDLLKNNLQVGSFYFTENTIKLENSSRITAILDKSYKWNEILNNVKENNFFNNTWLGNLIQKGKKLLSLDNS